MRTRALAGAGAIVVLTMIALLMQALGGLPDVAETMLSLAFAALGAVVASRAPGNRIGWLFLLVGLLMSAGQAGDSVFYAARDRFDAIGLAQVMTLATGWMWFPSLGVLATFCLLLFPDGHLPSRRWRPAAWIAAAGIVGGALTMFVFAFFELDTLVRDPNGDIAGPPVVEALMAVFGGLLLIGVLASIASLFTRWRRSQGVTRQQLKWFAFGGVVQLLGIAANFLDSGFGTFVSEVSTLALPTAAAVAITRYRLYDIDRLISRTLGWALISLVLGVVYVACVTAITAVTAPVAGKSPIAVAAATLAAAAAFGPTRRRIQTVVDHRFNRARYDAVRTAEAYRGRLRDQLELRSIAEDLVATVHATVAPTSAMIWLAGDPERP